MLYGFESNKQSGYAEGCPFPLKIEGNADRAIGVTLSLGVVLQNVFDKFTNRARGA
jgi:hypothetical protein